MARPPGASHTLRILGKDSEFPILGHVAMIGSQIAFKASASVLVIRVRLGDRLQQHVVMRVALIGVVRFGNSELNWAVGTTTKLVATRSQAQ
jgi:hypothetical protein